MPKKKKKDKLWIQHADIKEGKLTAKAKAAGMSLAEFMKAHENTDDPELKKEITLARTFRRLAKKNKKKA